jgi:hypothetical protein
MGSTRGSWAESGLWWRTVEVHSAAACAGRRSVPFGYWSRGTACNACAVLRRYYRSYLIVKTSDSTQRGRDPQFWRAVLRSS